MLSKKKNKMNENWKTPCLITEMFGFFCLSGFTLKTEIRKHGVFNKQIKSFILYTMLERILKNTKQTKG